MQRQKEKRDNRKYHAQVDRLQYQDKGFHMPPRLWFIYCHNRIARFMTWILGQPRRPA